MKRKMLIGLLVLIGLVCIGATGRALYYFEDQAHQSGDRGMLALAVRDDSPLTAKTGTTGDYSPLSVDDEGDLYVTDSAVLADTAAIQTAVEGAEDELDGTTTDGPLAKIAFTHDTMTFVRIDENLTGGAYSSALVPASSGNKIYVVELFLTVSAECELEWVEDPQGTPAILTTAPPMYYAQRGGVYMPRSPGYRFVTATANKALGFDEVANGTVNVRGYLYYYYAP